MGKESKVLKVSLPLIAQMTVYTFMSIFDMMMMGKYAGNIAVNVLGLSNALVNIFAGVFIINGIAIGMISLISRCIGAKKYHKAALCVYNGLIVGTILALVITFIIFIFGKNILYKMGAREDILYITLNFSKINALAMFFYMISTLLNSVFIAYDHSNIPFLTAIVQFLTKIFFNWIFMFNIFKTEININSSALSSLICYVVGFIFCFLKLNEYRTQIIGLYGKLKISFKAMMEIIYLSLPSSFEEAAYGISRLICTSIIMYSGTLAFSANEIANTIESISFMPGTGFGVAATTLVGINIGKGDVKGAKKSADHCAFWALLMMCSFSLIFLFMPSLLVKFFVNKEEWKVAYLAGRCLAIGAAEQPFIAISMVFAGALKGIGDTKGPFFISLFTAWIIRLPLIYYFIYILRYNITAVWWITAIQWGIDGILMFIFFRYRIYNYKNINKK
ncbi:MATE family efflux transporter [Clostridium amazonitimonense]|uniref:MATE family efflux transporter n=1 Tax=Clostridium amazonitimonense TaxID=1499689 RepID=UPI000509F20C|nr:MATE family efflux transporter [Clostridium amazonitimonense]